MASEVKIVYEDDGTAVLTMDAGGRPVCVDIGMCEALLKALSIVSRDHGDRVVLLRASGPVFSAGGDLFAIEQFLDNPDHLLAQLIDRFHEVVLGLRAWPMPVVAQVHGSAAGAGFSLVMACDFVVAGKTSRLVAGYPKIGTSSDGGLTFQLARRLGPAQAMNLFLREEIIGSERAHALGLVQVLAEDAELGSEAMALAKSLAARPVQAVKEIKALIRSATDSDLAAHLAREKDAFLRCARTPDFRRLVGEFTKRTQGKVTK